jgi:hypothetical protein
MGKSCHNTRLTRDASCTEYRCNFPAAIKSLGDSLEQMAKKGCLATSWQAVKTKLRKARAVFPRRILWASVKPFQGGFIQVLRKRVTMVPGSWLYIMVQDYKATFECDVRLGQWFYVSRVSVGRFGLLRFLPRSPSCQYRQHRHECGKGHTKVNTN